MRSHSPARYAETAEAGWRWVLDQVRWDDDGPSIPGDDGPPTGMHSGIGGLAHALAEIAVTRDLTSDERELAEGIADRVRGQVATSTCANYFDGLVSDIGALIALDAPGADQAVDRLARTAADDGWPSAAHGPPRFLPDARASDVTMGTGSVVLGAVWATRHGVPDAPALAARAADILVAEAEEEPTGLDWRSVPLRFRVQHGSEMPNWSHGLAGIAGVLALPGAELGRPDVVDAARRGAEHLVSLADTSDGGFRVPTQVPRPPGGDVEEFAYGWCHGTSGTSRLFAALGYAGVDAVAGQPPAAWERRCLHSARTSGLPERLRPGFWDNDGRCCGTAGVGEVFLDTWQRGGGEGRPDDLAFALHLADALVDRAIRDGRHATWRFVEHRRPDPLLPAGVGWMQGGAGIAAYLFRAARLARDGHDAPAVARMDNWWTLPTRPAG